MPRPLTVADAAIAIGGDLAGFDKSLDVARTKSATLGGTLKGIFSPANIIGGLATAGGAVMGIALTGATSSTPRPDGSRPTRA